MMREKDAQTDPNTQIKDTIGSGPFRFIADKWVPGSKVVYEKNADYVPRKEPPSGMAGGKVVHIDGVEWSNMADAQTAMAALQAGEIDFYETPPLDLLERIRGQSRHRDPGAEQARQCGRAADEPPPAALRQGRGAPGDAAPGRPEAVHAGGASATPTTIAFAARSSAVARRMESDVALDWMKTAPGLRARQEALQGGRL